MQPPRVAWNNFPDVLIHASESAVKQHPDYPAAKSGDAEAAARLVADTFSEGQAQVLERLAGEESATLVSAHAYETAGVNAIPEAFADTLAKYLGLSPTQLRELREKHGKELENWWQAHFGHRFDCLTQSEARYLARSENADTIRDRIVAAK
jgi:imidazolonepropionase-like amidohydrolase